MEVVREPAERDRAPEPDVAIRRESLGDPSGGLGEVDEVGAQMHEDGCLVQTAVNAHAELILGRRSAVGRRQRGMHEEGAQAGGESDLSQSGVEQRRVPAVAVEEHQALGGGGGDRPPDVEEN